MNEIKKIKRYMIDSENALERFQEALIAFTALPGLIRCPSPAF